MNDYLLFLILSALCLAAFPIDTRVKLALYVIIEVIGFLVAFHFNLVAVRQATRSEHT